MFYLIKLNRTYHLRLKLPPDIADILSKQELKFSLKVSRKRLAIKKVNAVKRRIRDLFEKIRLKELEVCSMLAKGELTKQEINQIVRNYVQQLIDFFDQEQATGKKRDLEPIIWKQTVDPLSVDAIDWELEGIDMVLAESKQGLAERRHKKIMERHVDLLLDEHGVSLDKNSVSYQMLCYETLKAKIRVLEADKKKLYADFEGTDKETILRDLGLLVSGQTINNVVNRPSDSPLLSDVVEEYKKQKIESKQWGETTVATNRNRIKAMIQFFGNRPVSQITMDDARIYAKVLELLPVGFSRLKEFKDISGVTADHLKGKYEKTLDVTTRRKYLNMAKNIFNFAYENEYIDKNPVISGIIPPKKKMTKKLRETFDMDDLRRIFNPDTYLKWSQDKPERFYIPLILLYTGCRVEEVASLYCKDVFEKDGIWCIDINDDNDRSVKTLSGIRTVPLHPVLVEDFKFSKYVEKMKAQGSQRVFPKLYKVSYKYSHEFVKRFSYYLRSTIKLSDPKKVLHSFRHLVTDHLYKAMVMESMIEELMGRAGKTETSTRYSKGYRVQTLYEECILKLDYEVDLSVLEVSDLIPK
jgi:integrase